MVPDLSATFMLPVSGYGYMETFVGIFAVAVFYWIRYNTWTQTEAGYVKARPPRQFTTWARFTIFAILYTLSMEIVYLLLLRASGLIWGIGTATGEAIGASAVSPETGAFPLWAAAFLMGICPYLPVVHRSEETLRHWLHGRAFIPAAAKALAGQLVHNPAFFKPDDEFAREVIRNYGLDRTGEWDSGSAGNLLGSQWFRLVYLCERLERWRTHPQFDKFLHRNHEEYNAFQEQFRGLNQDVQAFIRQENGVDRAQGSTSSGRSFQQIGSHLTGRIDKLLGWVHEFVVCGILSIGRTQHRRMALLNYFGIYPGYESGTPIMTGIVFKLGIIIFSISMLINFGYMGYLRYGSGPPLNLISALEWGIGYTLIIVTSIFVAAVVYREQVRTGGFDSWSRGGAKAIDPFVNRRVGIGFYTGYLSGLLVIFLYNYLYTAYGLEVLAALVRSLPWPLMPAVTAGFVVYYLARPTVVRHRLRDAVVQGLASGAAGLVSHIWSLSNLAELWDFGVYYIATCFCVGGAIGYFFPRDIRYQVRGGQPVSG